MNWCKLPLYSLRLALCDPIEVVWCRDKVDYPSTGPSAGVQHCPKGFLARMCSSVQLKRPISVFRIRRHAQKGSVYPKNTRLFLLCVQIADYHTSNITTLTMWRWLYFHWNELINVNNLLFGCQTTNKYISSFFFFLSCSGITLQVNCAWAPFSDNAYSTICLHSSTGRNNVDVTQTSTLHTTADEKRYKFGHSEFRFNSRSIRIKLHANNANKWADRCFGYILDWQLSSCGCDRTDVWSWVMRWTQMWCNVAIRTYNLLGISSILLLFFCLGRNS